MTYFRLDRPWIRSAPFTLIAILALLLGTSTIIALVGKSGRPATASSSEKIRAMDEVVSGISAPLQEYVPIFSKTFTPDISGLGSVSTLSFDIVNIDSHPVTDLVFTDTLPVGIVVATPSSAASTCGGTLNAANGGSVITLVDGVVGGSTACAIRINVVGNAVGSYRNLSGDLTSSAGNSGPALDTLTVDAARLRFRKSFAPSAVLFGEKSTLTFTLDNSGGPDIYQLNFTDNLPSGMVIATPANASHTCNPLVTTLTANAGSNVVTFFGSGAPGYPVIAAQSSCTVILDVSAGVGMYDNTSEDLVTTTATAGSISNGKATAALRVFPIQLFLTKSFTDDPASPGDAVTLDFTIDNFDHTYDATGISFTDDLNATLAGLQAIAWPADGFCGAGSQISGTSVLSMTGGALSAGSSCSFSVTLQVPAGVTPGSYVNKTSQITGIINGDGAGGNIATDTLVVEVSPALTKQFTDDPVIAGDPVTLEFTIANTVPISDATGIAFTDNLEAMLPGLQVTGLPANGFCGAGSQMIGTSILSMTGGALSVGESCTFTVTLQVPMDAQDGLFTNLTSAITSTLGAVTSIGSPAMDDLEIVEAPTLVKSFIDDPVAPGDTVTLEFTLTHSERASANATGISFTDDLDAVLTGLTAVGLPAADVCGPGSSLSGSSVLAFSSGFLAPGASCSFTATLQVPAGALFGAFTNSTSAVSATVAGVATQGNPATDDLEIAGLFVSKSFLDDPVVAGSTVKLNFALTNPSILSTVTNINFSDDLQAVVSGLTAVGLPASDICGTGSLMGGSSQLTFTGGSLAPGASCNFDVTLQVPAGVPAGEYANNTSGITADIDGKQVTVPPVSDKLSVSDILSLTKAFTDDPVPPGGAVTLAFTVTNSSLISDAGKISFSDDLDTALSGLNAVGLPLSDVCGPGSTLSGTSMLLLTDGFLNADSSCTFSVSLKVPSAAAPGLYLNTTSTVSGDVGSAVTGAAASDLLEVSNAGTIIVDKVTIPAGQETHFAFTISGGPLALNRSFGLTDAAPPAVNLVEAGSGYNVREFLPPTWGLLSATCDDGSPVDDIDVNPGEIVTCTFTNKTYYLYLPIRYN